MPARYNRFLILLHWLIVLLLIVQYFSSDGPRDASRAVERGVPPETFDLILANIHIWTGIAVLALTAARLAVRYATGVPAPVPGLSPWERMAAKGGHFVLYVLLIIVPATGAASVWINEEAGDVHEVLTNVLWLVAGLHIAAALWHHVIRRDGVMARMVPWIRPMRG